MYGFAGWVSGQSRVTRVPHLNAITPARAAPGRRCSARMGRRAGFCLNSLLAQREEKMAAEVGGEPEFENLGISYLEFAAAMEDGKEGALKQGGPGGTEKF